MLSRLVPITLSVALVVATGCSDSASSQSETTRRSLDMGQGDFPAESDLAILLGTQDAPVLDGTSLDDRGNPLLPRAWVDEVDRSFYDTDVEGAVGWENRYEDWRLVSVRVVPCAPLGLTPDPSIDDLCWPTVRLVWQPVVEDFQLLWGPWVDYYADDRAIHAIYPLDPRGPDGELRQRDTRDAVTAHLQNGGSPTSIPTDTLERFRRERTSTARWLLAETLNLRDPELFMGSWGGFDIRPELLDTEERAAGFADRLAAFLATTAPNRNLTEMTAFSLPEGRNPAGSDIWVFVAFDGNEGRPVLRDLDVIGRESGDVLVTIGPAQTVSVGVEDPAVEEALLNSPELQDSVIVTAEQIQTLGPAIADPYSFGVPNTPCASCHRLNNDLRFNFHALSGFETDDIFVSPRVVNDVARDISWTRAHL